MITKDQHSHPILRRQPKPKRTPPKAIVPVEELTPQRQANLRQIRRKRVGCCG